MMLARWDPFQDLMRLSDRLNRVVADASRGSDDPTFGAWAPTVDIFERGDNLVLHAELPGVDRDDIDVRAENGILTLRGERKRQEEIRESDAYRLERTYGAFTRSFTLPRTVDASKIEARYRDGVLEVVLPKVEEARPRRVEIQS